MSGTCVYSKCPIFVQCLLGRLAKCGADESARLKSLDTVIQGNSIDDLFLNLDREHVRRLVSNERWLRS
jgi:hypothetical protein